MAFSFFISLFPFLIVLFSIASFLPLGNLKASIDKSLEGLMPSEAHNYILGLVDQLIESFVQTSTGGILSIGFILVIFFASNGVMAMLRGFNKSYDHAFGSRNFLQNRILAIELTLVVGTLVLISIVLLFAGNLIIDQLRPILPSGSWAVIMIQVFRWFLIILLFYTVVSTLYRYGPATHTKFPFFSPGATLTTSMSLLTSIGFSYFTNNFGQQSKIYGSLAALIILLLWMQINCFIIMVGFELNTSIAVQKPLLLEEGEEEN
jgi:membrane protein